MEEIIANLTKYYKYLYILLFNKSKFQINLKLKDYKFQNNTSAKCTSNEVYFYCQL